MVHAETEHDRTHCQSPRSCPRRRQGADGAGGELRLARKYDHDPELLRTATIDGLPGYVSIDRGRVLQTTALAIRDGRIAAIYIVRNPDKLRHVAASLEASARALTPAV